MFRKTNFLSILVLVSEIDSFMTKKKSSLWISQKILQNNRKALFSSVWLNFLRKTVFVNIYPLLLVGSKKVVYTNPNFPQDLPLFKYGKKNKLAEYFSARFCDSHIYVKRKVLYEFPPKRFKTIERHILAVYSSLYGEKQFLIIFIPIY